MKNYKIELKYAVIFTLITIGWAVIGKIAGFHSYRIAGNLLFNTLILIPSFLVYYLAVREKRKVAFNGRMTFKQAFISGVMVTVFVTLLGPLAPIVTVKVISPEFFENSIKYVTAGGMMTKAEASRQFSLSAFIIQGLIAAPLFGLIFSAIAALLTRNDQQHGKSKN